MPYAEQLTDDGSGSIVLATDAESNAGSPAGKAVQPTGLLFIKPTSPGTAFVGGILTGNTRGANALDIQSVRSVSSMVSSGSGAVAYGVSCTASGDDSTTLGSSNLAGGDGSLAAGNNNNVAGVGGVGLGTSNDDQGFQYGVLVGFSNILGGDYAIALGFNNTVTAGFAFGANNTSSALAMGSSCTASGGSAVASGFSASASGSSSIAIGNVTNATGTGCVAIGHSASASTGTSTALGASANASGNISQAIGPSSNCRLTRATNIAGMIFVKKDANETGTDQTTLMVQHFAGANAVVMTKEITLLTGGNLQWTTPANSSFYVDECGVITSSLNGAVNATPFVRFGISTNNVKHVTTTQATNLTALGRRHKFTPTNNDDGESTMRLEVSTPGTLTSGSIYKGRFYWRGTLVEKQ